MIKCILKIFTILFLLSALVSPVFADGENNEKKNEDTAELAKLADDFFQSKMEKYHIPGAVISIVEDGSLIFEKGYGYSDLEKKIPADPEKTVFKVGSVSKVFTATAVMQLYEKGQLKLDTDINQYLKNFKIKSRNKQSITLTNLMTHTAGFDETTEIGEASYDLSKNYPLAEKLAKKIPDLIRKPGDVIQYSNYGMSLAGLIVQEKSGVLFEDYIKNNILSPLNMNSSSFTFPKEIMSKMAKSYYYKDGKFIFNKPINVGVMPSGTLNSTAIDMAHFMIAHLQNGLYEGNRILKEDTAKEMHKVHFQDYPGFDGYAYGFYYTQGGLMHSGAINGYNAYMCLIPDEEVGIFISINTNSPEFMSEVNSTFGWRFFSKYHDFSILPTDFRGDIKKFEGVYVPTRHSYDSVGKTSYIFPNSVMPLLNVNIKKNNILEINNQHYEPVGPLLFKNISNSEYLSFRLNSKGKIAYLFSSGGGSWKKIPWYENYYVSYILIGIFALTFTLVPIIILLLYVWYKIKRVKTEMNKVMKYLNLMVFALCIINITFIAGLYMVYRMVDTVINEMPLILLLILPVISIVLMVLISGVTVFARVRRSLGIRGLICALSMIIVNFIYILYLNNWNLVGFKIY